MPARMLLLLLILAAAAPAPVPPDPIPPADLTCFWPPLIDAERLPSREDCGKMLKFNETFAAWLELREAMEPARFEVLHLAWQDTRRLHAIWELAQEAGNAYYPAYTRRRALRELRELLGEEYERGEMPCPVPVWVLRRMD